MSNKLNKNLFSENEIADLFDIAIRCQNQSITSKPQLILELRGGSFVDWFTVLGVVISIIVILNNLNSVEGFVSLQGRTVLPNMEWLYGSQKPGDEYR